MIDLAVKSCGCFGQLDQESRVMTNEQKAGNLEETLGGLVKTYAGKPKSAAQQTSCSVVGLRGCLRMIGAAGSGKIRLTTGVPHEIA